jgi:hypothetical protein
MTKGRGDSQLAKESYIYTGIKISGWRLESIITDQLLIIKALDAAANHFQLFEQPPGSGESTFHEGVMSF